MPFHKYLIIVIIVMIINKLGIILKP
jgi:hypothetical protein